jgi:hypothetical protein
MGTQKITNITLVDFRRYLTKKGLTCQKCKSGHEKWEKQGLTRNITVPVHIKTVPEIVVQSTIKTLGLTKKEFLKEFSEL